MKQNSKQHHNRGDIFKRWVFEVFRARFTSTLDRIFFFYVISIVNHSAFRFALRSQGWHLVQSNQVSGSILRRHLLLQYVETLSLCIFIYILSHRQSPDIHILYSDTFLSVSFTTFLFFFDFGFKFQTIRFLFCIYLYFV